MKRYKKDFLYFLYLVIVIALIVGIALFFHDRHQNDTSHKTPATTAHPAGSSVSSSGTTKLAAPSDSAQSSSSASKAATTPAPLNNTGPGNVFGVFAVASIGGAWLYRRKLLRDVLR